MSGLVQYASSEDEDEIRPDKPAKVRCWCALHQEGFREPGNSYEPPSISILSSSLGPAAGPSLVDARRDDSPSPSESTGGSPYAFERQRIHDLTMPTVPNFSIPDSPSPPARGSEAAARLAGTTKKFERFLEMKKQGIHFNDRLQNSSSLRNPSLLPKLMEFAGIELADSHRSTLPQELGVPVVWPAECYVEYLVKRNEKGEKKRLSERQQVAFVPATVKAAESSAADEGCGLATQSRRLGCRRCTCHVTRALNIADVLAPHLVRTAEPRVENVFAGMIGRKRGRLPAASHDNEKVPGAAFRKRASYDNRTPSITPSHPDPTYPATPSSQPSNWCLCSRQRD
nr:meiotically up-regulated gene 151 protein [Quercus suber]